MQPTPAPSPAPSDAHPGPPVVGESLVDFVRADRQRSAYILLVLAALLLAVCGWAAWTASRTPAAEKKPESPLKIEEPETKVRNPNRNEYIVGAILAGLGALAAIGVGGWLLVSLPPPPSEPARQKTEARAAILAAGGLIGALAIVAGCAFFYLWSSSLFDWLDKDQTKQAKYVIGPLLAVAVGGLLMFLAIQPARAEERDNRTLRRLIYWTNLGLSVLLVFVALVVVNLIVGPRLPNKLDTTKSSFYALSDASRDFLTKMPEPVTAYAILPESGREAGDIRRLLQNCQDASGGKFVFKNVNPTADQSEYRTLAGKYPKLESNEVGVLLTVGEDQKRNEFIREDEFTHREPGAQGSPGTRAFVGEARLMRELQFLVENSQKAVVYFTQSSGELDIGGEDQNLRPSQSARLLKDYLARNYLEVRPLKFDAKAPKVPDDAAVVVVAEPRVPLKDEYVAAVRKYMTEPRAGGKKGKLMVLAGAQFGPKDDVLRTGLEELLGEFNVSLDKRFIMSDETREMDLVTTIALFTQQSRQARNPVAIALGEKAAFVGALWRPVGAARKGNPAYRAVPLLVTIPGRRSWLEDQFPSPNEINRIVAEVLTNPEVMRAKQLTDSPRSVAAAVSEGDTGRVVVVGNGRMLSDAAAQQAGEPPSFDLVGASIDWLRDRPPLSFNVENKKYVEFKFPAATDETRGKFLPLLLSVTLIGGLGVSVWMIRRRGA